MVLTVSEDAAIKSAFPYILGFDKMLKDETQHFVEADAAQASKEGKLADLVEKCFG